MITIENLTKRFGNLTAVNDISFEVRPGRVVGFLGPNGAGKSTAMRMMTGLTPATSGRAVIMGRQYRELPEPGRHVGVMLDASAQHHGRTGRETLRLVGLSLGLPRARTDEVLELVGLTEREARRRVRHYSLGMRQRLGIAAALIGDPQVLILDEPANGLDPQGIFWMRSLLRRYADEGGAVLLSSHLLNEVEAVADDVVMIGAGRIVAAGTKDEIVSSPGTTVRSSDDARLASLLRAVGVSVRSGPEGLQVAADPQRVNSIAADHGVAVLDLHGGGTSSLEATFLRLTHDTSREVGRA